MVKLYREKEILKRKIVKYGKIKCNYFIFSFPVIMFSLYRAWLSLGPCGSMPSIPPALPLAIPTPLNLSVPSNQVPGAPDVTLQVGPNVVQFAAHKAVLAAYSGYFKAALANHTGKEK